MLIGHITYGGLTPPPHRSFLHHNTMVAIGRELIDPKGPKGPDTLDMRDTVAIELVYIVRYIMYLSKTILKFISFLVLFIRLLSSIFLNIYEYLILFNYL